ncbi:unnamed protein product, partial [Staurois parvus]
GYTAGHRWTELVGALLGTGGRNLRVALLGTDHQGTDHQCPVEIVRGGIGTDHQGTDHQCPDDRSRPPVPHTCAHHCRPPVPISAAQQC